MDVAVVTDSTCCLPAQEIQKVAAPFLVVPLGVGIDTERYLEGVDVDGAAVARAQVQGRQLRTSRPGVEAFREVYARAQDLGARSIVSVHCSGGLSSTIASARTAASGAGVDIEVVDSGTLGMAMGFAAVAGATIAARGGSQLEVADTVRQIALSSVTTFYVDSLEPLRRGGRIGRAEALLGSALAIRPLLTVRHGVIEPVDRVRTTARAMDTLVRRTVEAARGIPDGHVPLIAVQALTRQDLAAQVGSDVAGALNMPVEDIVQAPLGAVVTAHVGAGTVGTAVAAFPAPR